MPDEIVNQGNFDGTGGRQPIIESDKALEEEKHNELNSEAE